MTEQAITTLVTAIIGGVTTVMLAWIALKQTQLKLIADTAATKVKEVAVSLKETTKAVDAKLDDIAATANITHKLVNSAMGIQLELHRDTTQQLAMLAPTELNIKTAEKAKQAYEEHIRKQAEADARPAKA